MNQVKPFASDSEGVQLRDLKSDKGLTDCNNSNCIIDMENPTVKIEKVEKEKREYRNAVNQEGVIRSVSAQSAQSGGESSHDNELHRPSTNSEHLLKAELNRKTNVDDALRSETIRSDITWHTDASRGSISSSRPSTAPTILSTAGVFKPTSNKQKTILFDCGNVLFYHSRFGMAKEMGLGSMICYMLSSFTSPRRVFDLAFEVMFMLGHQEEESEDRPYVTHQGDPLPGIMYEWLAGLKTNAEIVEEITNKIEHLAEYEDFFRSAMEKDLTIRAIETIFTPEKNVRNVHCLSKGVEIARRSKEKGHQNIILSNWDPESFTLVKKKFPVLFEKHIDNICISGDIKMNKPHECIYRHVLKEYNLNPADCIFIDDQEDNINAAQRCGIYGIQCLNHSEVISHLETLKII